MQKKPKAASAKKPTRSKMPTGKVIELAGLVSYAPDSIVSRTLVDNKAGSVTLFAFDAGQNLSEHTAPFDALVHVLDGEGEFIVGGKAHDVGAGQVLLMPAGVLHSVKAVVQFKMLLTMLQSKE